MGEPDSSNMAKLLLATLALLAVANATTVYQVEWGTSSSCAGHATTSIKITLDQCFKQTADATEYSKVSLAGGGNYKSFNEYENDACTDNGNAPANMITVSSAGTCYVLSESESLKILGDSPGATKNVDCTSGTCVNSASHATIGFIGIIAIFVSLVTNSM